MNFGSLFAGIGGFDLGLERAGMSCKWQVEIDDYATKVLEKHWPDVTRYRDIREVTELEPVDLICGGFPCQDLSYAGKGAGITGERSGLWKEYARIIRLVRPRFVLVENVPALLGRGMGVVLGDLAACGYDAEWDCIPAAAVGAPHQRDRAWIVAYPSENGQHKSCLGVRFLSEKPIVQSRCWGEWPVAASRFQRVVNGTSGVLDADERLGACGNAVVPQVVEWIGRRIVEAE